MPNNTAVTFISINFMKLKTTRERKLTLLVTLDGSSEQNNQHTEYLNNAVSEVDKIDNIHSTHIPIGNTS